MMLGCLADTEVKGESRWRDGDIRRHAQGADKVTTTLRHTLRPVSCDQFATNMYIRMWRSQTESSMFEAIRLVL